MNLTLENATKMACDLKKDRMSREVALFTVKSLAKPEIAQRAIELTYDGLKPVSTATGQATETEPEDLFPEIPDVFKSYDNWLTFESAEKKAPIISGTFAHAKSNDSMTWVSYPTLLQNIRDGKGYRNIGFHTRRRPHTLSDGGRYRQQRDRTDRRDCAVGVAHS